MSAKTAGDFVKEAKAEIENLSPEEVKAELDEGNATLIDIRESEELKENGKIPGSAHAPRGMLEWYADETQPNYHKAEFDKNKRLILHCAGGGRSALAVKTLKEMGYEDVAHLDGGIRAWKDAGLQTE